jgi:hypothetical protein
MTTNEKRRFNEVTNPISWTDRHKKLNSSYFPFKLRIELFLVDIILGIHTRIFSHYFYERHWQSFQKNIELSFVFYR